MAGDGKERDKRKKSSPINMSDFQVPVSYRTVKAQTPFIRSFDTDSNEIDAEVSKKGNLRRMAYGVWRMA